VGADADRWQSVFVDAAGGHGLLGQVEGRTKADVTGWLAAQDRSWLAGVGYVTIDLSSVYKSAVTTSGLLPNAALVADMFHVAQLCNKMIGDVRRRVTFEHVECGQHLQALDELGRVQVGPSEEPLDKIQLAAAAFQQGQLSPSVLSVGESQVKTGQDQSGRRSGDVRSDSQQQCAEEYQEKHVLHP
jgi:hypothetical protein